MEPGSPGYERPDPRRYGPFAGFVLVSALIAMALIIVLMFAVPFLMGQEMHEDFGTMVQAVLLSVPFALVFLVPVAVVSLTVGYAIWLLMLRARLGVLAAAFAVSTIGSATLAASLMPIVIASSGFRKLEAGEIGRAFLYNWIWILLICAPVAVFIAWRRYVRVV
jgi:hypothetical protein